MKHIFIINKYTLNKKLDIVSKKIEKACKELNINYTLEIICDKNQTEEALKKYLNSENIIIGVRW